jgi:hypothetical protein
MLPLLPHSRNAFLAVVVQVTTFHISTLSSSQHMAAASSQPLAGSTTSSIAGQQYDRRLSTCSILSSSSDSSEKPPELVQTWIVMEYCARGSLEQTVKLGKLKLPDGQADMVRGARSAASAAASVSQIGSQMTDTLAE